MDQSVSVQSQPEDRQSFSRDGHTYKNRCEYMKYMMRRQRNSDLPHYPNHEYPRERA